MSKSPPKDFLLFHALTFQQRVVALALLFFSLTLSKLQIIITIASHFAGGSERDAGLYLWLVKQNIRCLFTDQSIFNSNAFYPYGLSMLWSDFFFLPSLFVGAFEYLFGFVLAWNFVVLISFLLTGYFTFRLAYALSGNFYYSVMPGVLLIWSTYLGGQFGHPQLHHFYWVPLTLLFLFKALSSRRALWGLGLGLSVTAAFYTTAYYSIFAALSVGVVALSILLQRPAGYRPKFWVSLFAFSLLGCAPAIPLASSYLAVTDAFGSRELYEPYAFAANLLSYLSVSNWNLIYGSFLTFESGENTLFPGLVALVIFCFAAKRLAQAPGVKRLIYGSLLLLLFSAFAATPGWPLRVQLGRAPALYLAAAAEWISMILFCLSLYKLGKAEEKLKIKIITNRNLISTLLALGYFGVVFSLGPLGHPGKGDLALGVHALLHSLFPGVNAIRAVGRAGIMLFFSCALLVPFVLPLIDKINPYKKGLGLVLFSIFLFEQYNYIVPHQPLNPRPLIYDQISKSAKPDDAAIVLPLADEINDQGGVKSWGAFAEINVEIMNWMAGFPGRVVNGYSGQRTAVMKEFPRKLQGFPDKRSLHALSTIAGLKYIVFNSARVKDFNSEAFENSLRPYSALLKFISTDESGNYLFEFMPITDLDQPFYLQLPNLQGIIVNLELMSPDPGKSIKILVKDRDIEKSITGIELEGDGKWKFFSFTVPQTSKGLIPLRLVFEKDADRKVFLRARNLSSLK